jgi:hypothetical protein
VLNLSGRSGVWKAAGASALGTILLVTLAYRLPTTMVVDMGDAPLGALLTDNFHDAEEGYRWTRSTSRMRFLDPGASPTARVEIFLAGFRPRGTPPPILVIESGGETLRRSPGKRAELYELETRTEGVWSSTLEVFLRSDTFSPGAGDDRSLGIRVHEARLVLPNGSRPPLRQLAATLTLVLVGLFAGSRWRDSNTSGTSGLVASSVVAAAAGFAFAFARVWATILVPSLAVALGAALIVRWLLPEFARVIAETISRSRSALVNGLKALASGWAIYVAVLAISGTVLTYWSRPRFELDLGSGRADVVSRRFTGFDQEGGVNFRRALPGAALDLRDFGALSPWTVELRARSEVATDETALVTLLRAGNFELSGVLSSDWSLHRATLPAPSLGWRSGHWLEFPAIGDGRELQIDSLVIDRGRSFPSLGALLWILTSAWLVMASFAASGLSSRFGSVGATLFLALLFAGLILEPGILPRVLPSFFLAAFASLLLSAFGRGAFETLSTEVFVPELGPLALAISSFGFVLWFLATASPLYAGGHFGYHTAIAEEIWHGQFLLYYLPEPGSMLSRQPQWGNVIVPHSSLFHTIVAPFAAFPSIWFHTLTKLFLSTLLFAIATTSALLATRVCDPRTGTYAAAIVVGLPTGFQLLGLGHLMTLFGCWAATLALGFIILVSDRLSERLIFVVSLMLLSLCFLSYTGSLLFTSLSLAAAASLLFRKEPRLAKRLGTLLIAGWAVAMVLYYGNWILPFLSETIPSLVSGRSSDSIDFVSRIAAQPKKLAYTFGSSLVLLTGLAGLYRLQGRDRVLLGSWALVIVVFGLLDLAFNFLLKQHYYSFPAIAIGVALAFRWLEERGLWGRVVVGVFLVSICVMGLREAVSVSQNGF